MLTFFNLLLLVLAIHFAALSSAQNDEAKIVEIGKKIRYDGDQVIRFFIENAQQLRLLEKLEHWYQDRISFWKRTSIIGETVDVHVRVTFLTKNYEF